MAEMWRWSEKKIMVDLKKKVMVVRGVGDVEMLEKKKKEVLKIFFFFFIDM